MNFPQYRDDRRTLLDICVGYMYIICPSLLRATVQTTDLGLVNCYASNIKQTRYINELPTGCEAQLAWKCLFTPTFWGDFDQIKYDDDDNYEDDE